MKDFSKIETLENAVKWDYFRRVLAWPIEKIAYEMNVHTDRLKEWTNIRASAITAFLKTEKGRIEAIRDGLEKEYPPPLPETKEARVQRQRIEKLNVKAVAKDYMKDPAPNKLAEKYKIDPTQFRSWWGRNIGVINQEVNKLRSQAKEGHITNPI